MEGQMPPNRALDAAIALSRRPSLAAGMRLQTLPEGVGALLQILSGEPDALREARRATGLSESSLLAIVELYVLQILLHRDASPRRILGVNDAAERPEMRLHLRDLLNWLHPDKSTDPLRAAFAARVSDAWRHVNQTNQPGRLSGATMPTARRPSSRLNRVPWIALAPEPSSRHRNPMLFWRKGFLVAGAALAMAWVLLDPPSFEPFLGRFFPPVLSVVPQDSPPARSVAP